MTEVYQAKLQNAPAAKYGIRLFIDSAATYKTQSPQFPNDYLWKMFTAVYLLLPTHIWVFFVFYVESLTKNLIKVCECVCKKCGNVPHYDKLNFMTMWSGVERCLYVVIGLIKALGDSKVSQPHLSQQMSNKAIIFGRKKKHVRSRCSLSSAFRLQPHL